MSAQDFVDALNMKQFPQLGYRLVSVDGHLFWTDATNTYAANEAARGKK
jgi:hypothetical protein